MGENVTFMVHCAAEGKVTPQLFVWPKSPVVEMPEMLREALPELVSVSGWLALVVPGVWVANVKLVGERVETGAVATPVPKSATAWGLPEALSETERTAERAPLALGVNVMLIVQLPAAAKLWLQLLVWL
jgi:hypothetical protein